MRFLPAEVRDLVIDQLQADPLALKACSLTCRSWLPRARHHLFKSVKVDRSTCGETFKSMLDGSPSIAYCIRDLEFSGKKTECWWSGNANTVGRWPTLGQRMQRHMAPDAQDIEDWLRRILPQTKTALHRVKRLTLTSFPVSGMVAKLIRPYFCEVTELVINGCLATSFNDFVELRDALPLLRSLRVIDARWLPTSPLVDLPSFLPHSAISTMEFSRKVNIVTVFDWMIRQGRSLHLTSLSCYVTCHAAAKALKIMLETLGSNLQHLGIGFSEVRDPTEVLKSSDLTLKPCTGLRSIRISCATTERFSTYRISLSWILHILSSVTSPTIKEVIFSIPQRDISALYLDGLISVFSHKRYRSLQRLVFDVELQAEDILQEKDIRTRLSVLGRSLKFNVVYR
ncbi:hypothetical protein BXZ70DRAFT_893822 [Cristinia sonorae]|uniref:F-box domain-containing protein n=1 Tax=Cristinia sonorae TaxID=1940300 RepID=A0A8K0XPG8_9AGAR|nr:hypothetical protein BXZ70DRAFT_893822 [Cristinia sonorae]